MKINAIIKLLAIVTVIIIAFPMFTIAAGQNGDEDTNNGGYTIIHIAGGGHYKSGYYRLYPEDSLEVEVIVIEGGNVDVYIMTDNQYDNAYPRWDGEPYSISYLDISAENVKQYSATYEVPEEDDDNEDDYYFSGNSIVLCVVVDNNDCNITETDAVPTGPVTVKLHIEKHEEFDDPYGDEVCAIIGVIIMIVIISIIIIIYFISRKTPGKEPPRPAPPGPQYPYYPPYYGPYGPPHSPSIEDAPPPKPAPQSQTQKPFLKINL